MYKGKLYKTIEELDKAAGFKWSFGKCKECCYYDTDMYGTEGCLYINDYIDITDGLCNECKLKEKVLKHGIDIIE